MEHIEDDRGEAAVAAQLLKPGGRLIILSPAHPWLFSPFDKSIGHYRRYNRRMISRIVPDTLKKVRVRYLDSIGLFASAGNRFLLQSNMPTKKQIGLWDKMMVPLSRLCDPCSGFCFGKSILGVWQTAERDAES